MHLHIFGLWFSVAFLVASRVEAQMANGQYVLHPTNAMEVCVAVDITGREKVQTVMCNNVAQSQLRFWLKQTSTTTVSISPQEHHNVCLQGGPQGVAIEDCAEDDQQDWELQVDAGGSYLLRNAESGMCAAVTSVAAASDVVMLPCNVAGRRWTFQLVQSIRGPPLPVITEAVAPEEPPIHVFLPPLNEVGPVEPIIPVAMGPSGPLPDGGNTEVPKPEEATPKDTPATEENPAVPQAKEEVPVPAPLIEDPPLPAIEEAPLIEDPPLQAIDEPPLIEDPPPPAIEQPTLIEDPLIPPIIIERPEVSPQVPLPYEGDAKEPTSPPKQDIQPLPAVPLPAEVDPNVPLPNAKDPQEVPQDKPIIPLPIDSEGASPVSKDPQDPPLPSENGGGQQTPSSQEVPLPVESKPEVPLPAPKDVQNVGNLPVIPLPVEMGPPDEPLPPSTDSLAPAGGDEEDPEEGELPLEPQGVQEGTPLEAAATISQAYYQLNPNNGGPGFDALRGTACMDVEGYSMAEGADMQVGPCKALAGVDATLNNQVFLVASQGRYARISPQHEAKMCVTATSPKAGSTVEQMMCANTQQQQWQLSSLGDNQYLILSPTLGMCLAVAGNSQADWTKVVLAPCSAFLGANIWSLRQTALVPGPRVPVYNFVAALPPVQVDSQAGTVQIIGQPAAEGNLRVVGGIINGALTGRLEVYHGGVWGTICDDVFSNNNNAAGVACRQLGYAGGQPIPEFGGGLGPIHMDDVVCGLTGNRLVNCAFGDATNGVWSDTLKVWGSNNCVHEEDVGVTCYN